jgi:hypothetical protein
VGIDVFYDLQPFFVGLSGSYSTEVTEAPFDSYLVLYQDAFDPTSPLTNALNADADDGVGLLSLIVEDLVAGTLYFLVTSTFGNGEVGGFTVEISGPGAVTLGVPGTVIPEPAPIVGVGMAGLFGIAGLARRRRRASR